MCFGNLSLFALPIAGRIFLHAVIHIGVIPNASRTQQRSLDSVSKQGEIGDVLPRNTLGSNDSDDPDTSQQ